MSLLALATPPGPVSLVSDAAPSHAGPWIWVTAGTIGLVLVLVVAAFRAWSALVRHHASGMAFAYLGMFLPRRERVAARTRARETGLSLIAAWLTAPETEPPAQRSAPARRG